MNCVLKRVVSASVVCASTLALYTYVNSESIVRTDYTLFSDKVSREYKIILISDVHYGTAQRAEVLESSIEDINSVNADVVILAGDIVQCGRTSHKDMLRAFELLGSIKSNYGIYYITGNHDVVIGYSLDRRVQWYTMEDLHDALLVNNITNIDDTSVRVGELLFIGRSDRAMHSGGIRPEVAAYDSSCYRILVDHKPCEPDSSHISCELRLSGHTHAGQIFPINLYFTLKGAYRYGEHLLNDGSILIVSSGAGVGRYPLRNLGHCEYVVITIKPKQ